MIELRNNTVDVEFGKDQASIAISVTGKAMRLHELLKSKNIGNTITDSDIKISPSVMLHFSKAESVDTLIKALEKIKYNLLYPYGTLPLAC